MTGGGRYVDDLSLPGLLHAAFVRSTEAHARITAVDASAARSMPGVVGVFQASELGVDRPMPNLFPSPLIVQSIQAWPLTADEVRYVGEPIAVVVAEDRYLAADAAGAVLVEYEQLPAVVDLATALDSGAPPAHLGSDSNLVGTLRATYGRVEETFASADRVVAIELVQHRGAGASIEPRGVAARPDPDLRQLTVWSSTQSPFLLRASLAEYLDVPLPELRVIAPDVGGGFGPKAALYAEEYVVVALARRLGRPVRWVETRREHFTATLQQRDQIQHLEAAVTASGRLLGVRGRILHDNGAYVPYGVVLPATGLQLIPGPYVVPAFDVRVDVAFTNLTPTSPVRGAGRPYAVFAMERLVDAVGRELGLDPVEVRRRNLIPADRQPYPVPLKARDGKEIEYDGGDYRAALELALTAAGREDFPRRREEDRQRGLLRGMGVASYVEDTGMGPLEGARVEILPSGDVLVDTGAASQGQGHATVFAQLCAEQLGVDPERVEVRSADSDHYGHGVATVASRTAVTAASSVHLGAVRLRELVKALAAEQLEAAVEDLVLEGGMVAVRGQPGAQVSLAELAASLQVRPSTALPTGFGPGLAAEEVFRFDRPSYAFGTHVAEVVVDPETGVVDVVRYVVAHDCGILLNPMIVDGQIDGGVAHGLGNALSERLVHSPEGQPLVTTFMDYRIMSAASMPELVKVHTETPSPRNPLGVKGAGEGGTIPAAAAVAAAVEDALSELGVVVDRHPITPQWVRERIEARDPSLSR